MITFDEIHQLFIDLAFIIDEHQEHINNIEYRVSIAKDYAVTAEKSLNTAEDYQKKTRKCICLMVCLVACALTAILAPTLTLSRL